MDSFEKFKNYIQTLTNISDCEAQVIVDRFESCNVPKHNLLLKQGGRCNFWGFVYIGLIRVYSYDDEGEEYTNGFVREDGFITESMSFFTASPSLENMEALEDTELICIGPDALEKLYADFPVFEKFTRILYEQRMVEVKAKILYRVQFDGLARYQYFVETQPELHNRVPLKYIASYLNLTNSTLSRIRRKALKR